MLLACLAGGMSPEMSLMFIEIHFVLKRKKNLSYRLAVWSLFKLPLLFAALWDAPGLQLFVPFVLSWPSYAFSSQKVDYPEQMHTVKKNDNSVAEDQQPWAEEQQPCCLFIWFWHVNEDISDLAPTHCVSPWPWPGRELACVARDGSSQEVSGKFPACLLNSERSSAASEVLVKL